VILQFLSKEGLSTQGSCSWLEVQFGEDNYSAYSVITLELLTFRLREVHTTRIAVSGQDSEVRIGICIRPPDGTSSMGSRSITTETTSMNESSVITIRSSSASINHVFSVSVGVNCQLQTESRDDDG
jgi:hypothetical protein